jgi:hypothetical protein
MKKFPLSVFLIPLVMLVVLALIIHYSTKPKKIPLKPAENTPISANSGQNGKISDNSTQGLPFDSRVPIYPNSQKCMLKDGAEVTEAAYYSSTDPVGTIKDWYMENLQKDGIKVNLIDVTNKDGFRTITISMPDPPKELVEIKERFMSTKDVLITITTVDFYTQNLPVPIDINELKPVEKKKTSSENSADDQNKNGQDGET